MTRVGSSSVLTSSVGRTCASRTCTRPSRDVLWLLQPEPGVVCRAFRLWSLPGLLSLLARSACASRTCTTVSATRSGGHARRHSELAPGAAWSDSGLCPVFALTSSRANVSARWCKSARAFSCKVGAARSSRDAPQLFQLEPGAAWSDFGVCPLRSDFFQEQRAEWWHVTCSAFGVRRKSFSCFRLRVQSLDGASHSALLRSVVRDSGRRAC